MVHFPADVMCANMLDGNTDLSRGNSTYFQPQKDNDFAPVFSFHAPPSTKNDQGKDRRHQETDTYSCRCYVHEAGSPSQTRWISEICSQFGTLRAADHLLVSHLFHRLRCIQRCVVLPPQGDLFRGRSP
jgi:hypothetical protein